MIASKISLDNAKKDKLWYFVANAVVYRESDGRCLILKRSEQEPVFPGKYAVPGGKLEWKELDLKHPTRINSGDVLDYPNAVPELLRREVREEAGIEVGADMIYINSSAFVRPDEIPVVMIKFAVSYKSGAVKLEKGAFTDHAWVNSDEVKTYDCIEVTNEDVAKAITKLAKSGDAKQ